MPLTYSTHIAAPIRTVWEHIEDPELQKVWMHGLISNEVVEGERGVAGGTFRMLIKEGGKEQTYDGVLTACDEPRHLAVRFWGGCFGTGMKATADYRLREADGGTHLDYRCDFEGQMGLFMKLLSPVMMLFGKMHLKKMMKSLKRHAEAAGAA